MTKLQLLFLDHKKRNLILWVTDIIVAVSSYFYITKVDYLKNVLQHIDFTKIRPDVDPEIFISTEFIEYLHKMISVVAAVAFLIIIVLHAILFFKCYKRKRAAIAYVKVYCLLAVVSLLFWFLNNVSPNGALVLMPALIYGGVFLAENK